MRRWSRKPTKEVTTTANVPVYFPEKPNRNNKEENVMNHAQLALQLVESGVSHKDALETVISGNPTIAARKVTESITDSKKRAAAAKKFTEQLEEKLRSLNSSWPEYRFESNEKDKDKEEAKDKDDDKPEEAEDDDKDPKDKKPKDEADKEKDDKEKEEGEDPEVEDDDPLGIHK